MKLHGVLGTLLIVHYQALLVSCENSKASHRGNEKSVAMLRGSEGTDSQNLVDDNGWEHSIAKKFIGDNYEAMKMINLAGYYDGNHSTDETWQIWVVSLFVMKASFLWFYALSRWRNLFLSVWTTRLFTDKPKERHKGGFLPGKEPLVTVQICTFNEGAVIEETIRAACQVDWPRKLLVIHILDDSTDVESTKIIEHEVAYWQSCGVNIRRLSRPNRIGYKAGNLRYHFEAVESEYVAYFDADHRMEPNFLKRTVPLFFDEEGNSRDKIALVQAPWCFYNTHQNLLTECDAFGLDAHHVVEQVSRATNKVFGFNGTGGIWRKQAVIDAGGWSWETVTEDLALSYSAYLRGYEMIYVRDIPQMLEVPSCILAHVQQKHRWTKGFFQVLRISYRHILHSPQVPYLVKFEAFAHMTSAIQNLCVMVMLALMPLLAREHIDNPFLQFLSLFPVADPCFAAILAAFTKVPGSNGHYEKLSSRFCRLAVLIPYIGLRTGMCVFETKFVLEGLLSKDATFYTTPKEGAISNERHKVSKKRRQGSVNRVTRLCVDDIVALLGLALGIHLMTYIFFIDYFSVDKVSYALVSRFIVLSICCSGLFWVNGLFLLSKYARNPAKAYFALFRKEARVIILILLPMMMGQIFWNYSNNAVVPKDTLLTATSFLPPAGTKEPLTCKPQEIQAEPMTPVVVFADPRTGSNLFFNILQILNWKTPNEDVLLSVLFELFGIEHSSNQAFPLFRDMLIACGYPKQSETTQEFITTWDERRHTDQEGFVSYLEEKVRGEWVAFRPLLERFNERGKRPMDLFNYLKHAPWASKRPLVAFKIFSYHFDAISMTPLSFVNSMEETAPAKYVVLWRRRVIEEFVSRQIAKETGKWHNMQEGKSKAVRTVAIKRAELEDYIQERKNYYESIRSSLAANGVDYEVFEYARDLKEPDEQVHTVKRIKQFLDLATQDTEEAILQELFYAKQAQVPLSEQVLNWGEVVQWGYGGEVEDWEDLFPGK